ncbi:uncharacterized protein ARMOST_16970 [Armillaria ostoyae]|uniref:CCHC-type domain-containing protein n=1 Tax=Armillaria ostoyae TaxID=47428 RepID=A0A284RXP9_ARMOS|nr:uncharacterized protein ARMOST_16970 [Armillaria ostoyae]
MVKAVQLSVPDSYTNAIANSSENILVTYNDWKRCILRIYEERQKKWVFDQTLGNSSRHINPQKNPTTNTTHTTTTATSYSKADGMTSLSLAKPMSSAAPMGGRDSGGRWLARPGTTFGGQGAPMDIGKLRAEGRYFRCHKKGHMGKDCPEKKDFRDIRSVQVTNEPVMESKVEEVKKEKAAAV